MVTYISPWKPSKLLHISILYYFLLLSSIPFYGYIIHLLKDIWIVFILLTNTNRVAVNIYRFLCKLKFSILWEKFPISRVRLFVTPWTVACQATLSISNSWIYSISCPLSRWCHPTTSSSVIHFSHLQSFPASGFFPMSQFFASGGQRLVGSHCCPGDSQESSPTP